MNDPQTVTTQTDTPAEPTTEVSGAPEKSVDDLLKEFDVKTQPEPTPQPSSDTGERLNKVLDFVEQKATEEVNQQTSKDIETAVKAAVGESDLDPEYVEGKLHYKANTDPAFRNAWMSRHEKPDQFRQVLKAYGKELAVSRSSIDQPVTDDRAAVAAAVRSQTTKPADAPPSNKDIRRMSDSELARHKRELLRG